MSGLLLRVSLLVLALCTAQGARAASVTNTNDSGPGSLRRAIAETPTGGTITFALSGCPCTILLTSGELTIVKSVTIIAPGSDQVTINGNNAGRIFSVTGPVNPAPPIVVELEGLSIVNGRPGVNRIMEGAGGGIVSQNARLTIRDCTISNNIGQMLGGGGIYGAGSEMTIINSTISHNRAGLGGGIANGGQSRLEIVDSVISDNEAFLAGGGVYSIRAYASVIDSTIARNKAPHGSGAYLYQFSDAVLLRCTVEENWAANGGAIMVYASTAHIMNTTVSGNTAGWGSAGIVHDNGFDDPYLGNFHSTLTVTNSTVAFNKGGSTAFTGGLFIAGYPPEFPTTTTVANSIIAGNTPGPDVAQAGVTKFASSGYNLIGDRGEAIGFDQIGDQTGTSRSIIDPLLEPLRLNGGPTRTHALRLNSPALDRGFSFSIASDQRGLGRPQDVPVVENAIGGDGSDIGAFEARFALVSGSVRTAQGSPIRNAVVSITSASGETWTTITSTFGTYSFENVVAGQNYTLRASAKRYRFQAKAQLIVDNTPDLDLTADTSD